MRLPNRTQNHRRCRRRAKYSYRIRTLATVWYCNTEQLRSTEPTDYVVCCRQKHARAPPPPSPATDPSAVITNNGQGHLTLHQLYHHLSESHQSIVNIKQESNMLSYYAASLAHPIRII